MVMTAGLRVLAIPRHDPVDAHTMGGIVRGAVNTSSERLKFIEKNELPIYDGTQEYRLWLGCMGSYDPQGREIVFQLKRRAGRASA
jgi:hypothetical protein